MNLLSQKIAHFLLSQNSNNDVFKDFILSVLMGTEMNPKDIQNSNLSINCLRKFSFMENE